MSKTFGGQQEAANRGLLRESPQATSGFKFAREPTYSTQQFVILNIQHIYFAGLTPLQFYYITFILKGKDYVTLGL